MPLGCSQSLRVSLAPFKFVIHREFHPRVEFPTDILFKQKISSFYIVEIYCFIDNKGLARHKFPNLSFKLHGLKPSDPLADGDSTVSNQLYFPHTIKEGNWVPKSWEYSYVEPGVRDRNTDTLQRLRLYIALFSWTDI